MKKLAAQFSFRETGRPQPYRATTGLPMQTVRHLMIPSPTQPLSKCASTSSHNYVRITKLPPYRRLLAARRARNYPFHASPPRVATSPDSDFKTLPSFTGAESCPQIHSSTHHCERLPSSPLVENALERDGVNARLMNGSIRLDTLLEQSGTVEDHLRVHD
jgi:hypothetical protein